MTLCVASQQVFILVVYFVMTQSGNFWIHCHNNVYKKKGISVRPCCEI
jgi:hypothetical protein